MDSFSFFVPGEPITEGSTKAFTSGQRIVVTHDRGRELDAWRIKVAKAAQEAAREARPGQAHPRRRRRSRALQQPGVLRDDSRIVEWRATKLYARSEPGVHVAIMAVDGKFDPLHDHVTEVAA